jgi:Tfp pilus assembly protein PilE
MGQQQLLLIVLGVIIVGIAVAVGINMFSSSAVDANRDAVTADLAHLGSKAQQFYKKPTTMGGGGNDFNGFALGSLDQTNTNGEYRLATAAPAALVAAAPAAAAANTAIAAAAQTIYIVGYGTETGRDGTNLVMAYCTVTSTGISTTVLN